VYCSGPRRFACHLHHGRLSEGIFECLLPWRRRLNPARGKREKLPKLRILRANERLCEECARLTLPAGKCVMYALDSRYIRVSRRLAKSVVSRVIDGSATRWPQSGEVVQIPGLATSFHVLNSRGGDRDSEFILKRLEVVLGEAQP